MNKIRQLREEKNMSQSQLAKALNLAQQTISGYENNSRVFDTEKAIKIADYFNVSVDYLLGHSKIRAKYSNESCDIGLDLERLLHLFEKQDIMVFNDAALDEKVKRYMMKTIEMLIDILRTN